ncbi:MAG: helix-turn-helix transcriptional regulator [Saprospiraceae bacterium]|nr:helix-turn-helix transcriptional regulator [Saprospiraceae bacterium]
MNLHMITTNLLVSGNILLLMLGGLQGLLLGFLLLRKKAYREGYGFLIFYLTVMIAQLVFKVLDKWWMMQQLHTAYRISYLLPFLYGPLVLLFAKSFAAGSDRFKLSDTLHFAPFLLCCGGLYFRYSWPWAGWAIEAMKSWNALAPQLVLLGAYHYRAFSLCSRVLDADVKLAEKGHWIRQFILHSWWICSTISCLLILIYQTYPNLAALRFGFVLLTVFIYWVSYSALQQPALFFRPSALPWNETALPPPNGRVVLPNKEKKYVNSALKESEAARIEATLQELALQRIFTDNALTIEKLAELAGTNRHTLSQVLNERLGKSFFDYVNGLRVAEAKRLLGDPLRQHLKISAIAYDAGFNSLSVFNDVFKKQTGQTPSDFRKIVMISRI